MLDLWAEGCCSTGPDLADIVGNMDTQIGNSLHTKMEEFQTAGSPDESAAGQRLGGWTIARPVGLSDSWMVKNPCCNVPYH